MMAEGHSTPRSQRLVINDGSRSRKHISNVFAKLRLHDSGGQHRRVVGGLPTMRPQASQPEPGSSRTIPDLTNHSGPEYPRGE